MEKPKVEGRFLYEMAKAVKIANRHIIQLAEGDYSDIYELQVILRGLKMCAKEIAVDARAIQSQLGEV